MRAFDVIAMFYPLIRAAEPDRAVGLGLAIDALDLVLEAGEAKFFQARVGATE